MTDIHVTWNPAGLKTTRSLDVVAGGMFGMLDGGFTSGQRIIGAASRTTGTGASAALDRFNATYAANEQALLGLKNTYRANSTSANGGEVNVWIDNPGLKDDLRWRGNLAVAPDAVKDIVYSAQGVCQEQFGTI